MESAGFRQTPATKPPLRVRVRVRVRVRQVYIYCGWRSWQLSELSLPRFRQTLLEK